MESESALQVAVAALKSGAELTAEEEQELFDFVCVTLTEQLRGAGLDEELCAEISDSIRKDGYTVALDSNDEPYLVIGMDSLGVSPDQVVSAGLSVYNIDEEIPDEGERDG